LCALIEIDKTCSTKSDIDLRVALDLVKRRFCNRILRDRSHGFFRSERVFLRDVSEPQHLTVSDNS
jgi:hypothetical protein